VKKNTKSSKVKTQFTADEMAKVIPLRVTATGYIETINWVREHSDLGLRGSKELIDDVHSGEYERFSAVLGAEEQLEEVELELAGPTVARRQSVAEKTGRRRRGGGNQPPTSLP
jgi:hypothetical protein